MSKIKFDFDGPRLASEIEEQLAELAEILREFESAPDFGNAGQMHLESLKAHELDLRRELSTARDRERTTNGHE